MLADTWGGGSVFSSSVILGKAIIQGKVIHPRIFGQQKLASKGFLLLFYTKLGGSGKSWGSKAKMVKGGTEFSKNLQKTHIF